MTFSDIYDAYVAKVERKDRTRDELDHIICWLTGYSHDDLDQAIGDSRTVEEFFLAASMTPEADLITGSICGVKVQDIEDPMMKKVRQLDKVVDELAKGKPVEKIQRSR